MPTFIILVTLKDETFYVSQKRGDFYLTLDLSKAIQYPSKYAAKAAAKHLPNKVTRGGVVWTNQMPQ
jgi:hypothetical protein